MADAADQRKMLDELVLPDRRVTLPQGTVTGDAANLVSADLLVALRTAAESRFLHLLGQGTLAHDGSSVLWRARNPTALEVV
jgi:hypothetical protein